MKEDHKLIKLIRDDLLRLSETKNNFITNSAYVKRVYTRIQKRLDKLKKLKKPHYVLIIKRKNKNHLKF
jgi:hypothetical protein